MSKQIITRHKRLIAIIGAVIIFALIPLLVSSPYYLDLLIMMLVHATLGMCFIMTLRTGLINMSLAAVWGVGAYASTMLAIKLDLSFWLCLPASVLITGVIALGLGYILIGSGAGGLSFVVLSSVIGMLFSVTIGNIPFFGGYTGIVNIPPPDPIHIPFLPAIEFTSKIPFFYLALFLFVIVVLISSAFYSAWTGRAWTAIGLTPNLAESIGINTVSYKLSAFVLSSCLAGLMGCFFAHYHSFVSPNTYTMWQNVYIQIYAILGGIGYVISGPIVGAAVMTFIPEFMRSAEEFTPIFTGILLIVLVMFLPRGLLSLIDRRAEVAEGVANIRKVFGSVFSVRRKGSGT
jgi:branched-chain amino acid transport system permease protein